MKKYCLLFLFLVVLHSVTWAQQNPDSLKYIFRNATVESLRYEAGRTLYVLYEERNRDTAYYYADQCLSLAKKNNKKLVEAVFLDLKGYQLLHLGQYAASLQCLLEAFKIAEDPKNDMEEAWRLTTYPSPGKNRLLVLALTHHMFGILMEQTQNVKQQIIHFKAAREIALEIKNQNRHLLADMNLGNSYMAINEPDTALAFMQEAEQVVAASGINRFKGFISSIIGDIYLPKGDKEKAKTYYQEGLRISSELNNTSSMSRNMLRLINYYAEKGQDDSVLYFAIKNLEVIRSMGAIASA